MNTNSKTAEGGKEGRKEGAREGGRINIGVCLCVGSRDPFIDHPYGFCYSLLLSLSHFLLLLFLQYLSLLPVTCIFDVLQGKRS